MAEGSGCRHFPWTGIAVGQSMLALTTVIWRTLGRKWWHKETNFNYPHETSEHKCMSEYPMNLKKWLIRIRLEGKKKRSTFVESMSAWACSDMDHPVITTLEVEWDRWSKGNRRSKIITLLQERHCATHDNQKCRKYKEEILPDYFAIDKFLEFLQPTL